jgi:hypothetical protein
MTDDLWSFPALAARCGVDAMTGFAVQAQDGPIGTVTHGGVEAGRSYLIVRLDARLGARRAMLPAGVVERVDALAAVVGIGCSSLQVARAPRFETDRYRDGAYRAELGLHYSATRLVR